MKFYKYCGAGNDFIIVEDLDGALTDLPALARRLCARHFSVGADGLIVVERPERGGDCRMRFFNCDGSAAEMCGNGARCLSRFCFDRGLSGPVQRIETAAGMVVGERVDEGTYRVQLNTPGTIRLQAGAAGTPCDYLELGEGGILHAVVETDLARDRAELREFARALRHAPEFPRGANVNLCQVLGEDEVRLLTYERGVEDFTLACGTGAGATAAALTLRGRVAGEQTRVVTDGGLLSVEVRRGTMEIFLTGPADFAFSGEVESCFPACK